jgi:NTP pyrophosphatase (non-canonical NTP hydrolase)
MKEMVEAIRRLHAKHGFSEKGGEDMLFRMNLIMEEVGEICECLTKGHGDIAEEHADLLILLLGNCIALDIDIEKEFWRKLNMIMAANSVSVNGHARVLTSARR